MPVLTTSMSEPLSASRRDAIWFSTSSLSSDETLSPRSLIARSAWKVRASAWLRVSTSSRRCLSSSACSWASRTIWSTALLSSIDEAVIRTCCSLPVARSLALTSRMPLASMSNVTSICGMPRGAGGIPSRMNRPSVLLSAAKSRSPWRTWISTCDCESRRGREDLRLRGRDGRVALDELGHDAAERLDAERQRRHVEEQDVLDVAGQDAGLDRGADGHDLVRVDALVRLLAAEHRLDRLDDGRHPGHATDEDDLVDVARLEAGVLERGRDRALGLLDEVGDEVLELGPGERHHEVLRARWRRR